NNGLKDYSYRSWQGLLADYYYPRWEYYFKNDCTHPNGNAKNYFYFEWNWAHGLTHKVGQTAKSTTRLTEGAKGYSYSREPENTNSVEVAKAMLAKYIIPVKYNDGSTYYAYRTFTTDLTDKATVNTTSDSSVDFTKFFNVPADAVVTGDFINNNEQSANIKAVPTVGAEGTYTGTITIADGTVLQNFTVVLTEAQFNGYYNISWQNGETEVPMFIGYNEENDDWVGEDHKGYKMLGTGVYTTESEADKVFHIVPQENGYSISAQGKNLVAINFNAWNHLQFSDDKNAAGVYNLIKQTDLENVYKIQGVGENDGAGEHNDYLQVYNTEGKMIVGPNPVGSAHNFKLVPATEYTLTVPASGYAAVCLPFNVVLPEGVEAYDINNLEKQNLVSGEVLTKIAGAGGIVMAGTPMVVKATAGDHTLGITMESEGAKTSLVGSVLRGNFVKQNLAVSAEHKTFVLVGDVWTLLEIGSEMPANTCWMEVAELDYDYNIDMTPELVEIGGWKFRYEYTTNGVKLTDAAVYGNGELVIPAQVTFGEESRNVDAISPDFLHGNTTLTSIKFPATLTNLGFRVVEPMFGDDTTVYEGEEGDGGKYEGNKEISQVGAHRCFKFPIDPSSATGDRFKVDSKSAWRLTLDVTIDDPKLNLNNYGSAIVSTNENSLADNYSNGDMQIYMKAGHDSIIVKIDNADDRYTYTLPVLDNEGKETGELVAHSHFVFELEHDGTGGYQVVIYYDDGRKKMYSISADEGAIVKDFSKLYYSLPKGIRVKVKVDKLISQGLFVGCTNLQKIEVDENNPTFMACDHGVLYDKNQYYVMRIPEGDPGDLVNGRKHFEIPSKVVKLYAGSFHGVDADIVLHSNPIIGVVEGHKDAVKNAKFFLSLDDIDGTIAVGETGHGGARDFISTNNNEYLSARYKRTPLAEDKYGTICLPFVPENALGKYDFFEFKYGEVNSFVFSQVASVNDLKANTPYLYKLKDEDKRGDMESENGLDVFETSKRFTVDTHAKYNPAEEEAGTSRALGTYVNFYIETKNYKDKSAYYYFSTGQQKFLKVTEQLNYRPYRAIFVVNPKDGNTSQAPARISLRLLDGTTTDIDASLVEGMETPVYYDISGRRVLNPGSGVYIVNGKKVFIK
ncbi:MAG: alpha-N-acetylglucosaminidase C-terminal domain-containing protein, partial [Prevotellamassilia sp.]|nr:alpha-N-acetylglucosaminidase C-terminal domain-containing protein [Prevotellamassilia sp.]